MKKEKVIVLGAGIAGLTCGINLLQKGYDVSIYEKNDDVGGLCSGYFKDGHYIDACFHWMMGTNKKSMLYKEWTNIGALGKDVNIISLPTLGTFEYKGDKVTFYRDLDKTEKELLKLSPDDEKAIHKFINSVKDTGSIMGLVLKNSHLDKEGVLHMLPNFAHIVKSMRESRETYSLRFKHPAIRFALKNAQTGYNNMFFFLDLYGLFSNGNADVPEGGAHYLVQRVKERYLSLGGKLLLKHEVKEIITENDKAVAIRTNKREHRADYIISTIDPYYTLRTLLNNKYNISLFDRLEKTVEKRSISSCFNVYVTVDADVTHIDVPTIFETRSMKIGARKVKSLLVRPYHFDSHFIKDGKTVVSLFVDQNEKDYRYFKALEHTQYRRMKRRIAHTMIKAFLTRYPELEGKVSLLSSFGPLEINKRTNTSFGSIQSYSFTDQKLFYSYNGKFKEVDNLYLCGQWNRAIGGTPTALLAALDVCKLFE